MDNGRLKLRYLIRNPAHLRPENEISRVSTGALDDIRRATDMAYKAVAEYGLNQTIAPVSIATLSAGGMDDSGGGAPWGRDQERLKHCY
ncbi:unnamed protein product [Prunus armeniaca]|uniref:Peptidase M41 domain-containing protein n=1 Tax=Prunus armeniaca TaxID=36596 RepID=A0A6J5V2E8_PRUAR|nr:unnamed protein product [Prunus armeniaca]CAB4312792.1 unnamed protein product [Prunus armeniaca]